MVSHSIELQLILMTRKGYQIIYTGYRNHLDRIQISVVLVSYLAFDITQNKDQNC
jgi:hypothetical protein